MSTQQKQKIKVLKQLLKTSGASVLPAQLRGQLQTAVIVNPRFPKRRHAKDRPLNTCREKS